MSKPTKKPKSVSATKVSKKPEPKKKTNQSVSSDDLPRKTLEESLRIAKVIQENYAGKDATWEDIAQGMQFSSTNPNNKYFLWSATAYGIISKQDGDKYSLTEIGRKILAPMYDEESREGIVKAIAIPAILARFYSDYSSSSLPAGEIFRNVLAQKYNIPAGRIDEAKDLILANARFAGLLEESAEGKLRLLSSNAAVGVGENGTSESAAIQHSADQNIQERSRADYNNICFIITPIGEENSPERKHADAMLRHLIEPVLTGFGIKLVRADTISKPGHITKQIVEHIAFSKLCITDLSFGNQNAHYELGIRHALKLPSVQIIRKGDKIPFDIQQSRTIIIDTSDPYTIMDRIASAKAELQEHIKSMRDESKRADDSPIMMYLPHLSVKIG